MPTQFPTVEELNQNIFFVHRTPILPTGKWMSPGAVYSNKEIRPSLQSHMYYLQHMPNKRMTIHWFINDLVRAHEDWTTDKDARYVVIERAKYLRPYLYGGFAEDMWNIGHYQLSSEAIIFVPVEELAEAKLKLSPFFGEIIAYTPQDDLGTLVSQTIEKRSKWKIKIPSNQKTMVTLEINTLQKAMDINPDAFSSQLQNLKERMKEAIENGQSTIMVEDNQSPDQLVMICNGEKYQASDFFGSWYKTGLYKGSHDASIFYKFENYADKLFLPLLLHFENPNVFDLSKVFLDKEKNMPVVSSCEEMKNAIQTVRSALNEIKLEIANRRDLSPQIQAYFKDEWEINFTKWLVLFEEDIALRAKGKSGLFLDTRILDQSIKKIVSETSYTIGLYENEPIANQSVAVFLTENYGKKFHAFLQKNKAFYVDAISDELSTEEQNELSQKFYSQHIPCFFFKNRIVIPHINTEKVFQVILKN